MTEGEDGPRQLPPHGSLSGSSSSGSGSSGGAGPAAAAGWTPPQIGSAILLETSTLQTLVKEGGSTAGATVTTATMAMATAMMVTWWIGPASSTAMPGIPNARGGGPGRRRRGVCYNILSGYLSVVTTVFSHQGGIYGFKFPKRFSGDLFLRSLSFTLFLN